MAHIHEEINGVEYYEASHNWYAVAFVSSSECHVSLHCLCTMDDELFTASKYMLRLAPQCC